METTLNLHASTLVSITAAARAKGVSRSALIRTLFKRIMNDMSDPDTIGIVVRYQGRRRPEEWHVFHLQVRPDEYEFFLDLKKLLKMSVSLILAIAVKKYLNGKEALSTDNYRYKDYTIIKMTTGNMLTWKFIWGYSTTMERLDI